MRHFLSLFVFCLLAFPAFSQHPLTEKIDVNVVNVDVSVMDRAGKPVRGLTRDDFEVFEDGRRQAITNFYSVENKPASAIANTAQDERFRRKVLVIVDNVTTSRFNRDRALDRLEQFVNDRFTGGEYEWSLALVDRRAHMLLAPTSEKQQIFDAIGEIRKLVAGDVARLSTRSIDSRVESLLTLPTDVGVSAVNAACSKQRLSGMLAEGDRMLLAISEGNSIAALTQAVRGFSSTDGKKIILLLTSEYLLRGGYDPLAVAACMPAGAQRQLADAERRRTNLRDYLVHESNASSVSLYIINTEGFRAPQYVREDQLGAGSSTDTFVPPTDNGSLYWLARQTGGRLLPGNDVAASLRTFDVISSNFYSLGYRPTHGDDDKYHRIHVRMKRPGTFQLQYRDGYSSIPSRTQLIRLLQSPIAPAMQPSTLPLEIAIGLPAATSKKGELLVPVSAVFPSSNLTFLPGSAAPVEIFFSLFDSSGRNVALVRFDRQAKNGDPSFIERHALKVRKGETYRVVVAIRDPLTDALGLAQSVVHF